MGLLAYSAAGAFLAVAIFFRKRFDIAAQPATPQSISAAWLMALTTFSIGVIAGFVLTPVSAEYISLPPGPRFNFAACAIAALGVPITLGLTALGEKMLGKWIQSRE